MGRESVAEGTLVCLTRINVYSKCQLLSGLEVVMTEAQGHPMLEKVSLTSSSSLLKPFRTPCNCSCTEVQIENCLTQLISSRERESITYLEICFILIGKYHILGWLVFQKKRSLRV